MDKQPTWEQIREFWEWCGFRIALLEDKSYDVYEPDGTFFDGGRFKPVEQCLPDLDLNNLFKYAMPLTIKGLMEKNQGWTEYRAIHYLFQAWELEYRTHRVFDLALFWAIWRFHIRFCPMPSGSFFLAGDGADSLEVGNPVGKGQRVQPPRKRLRDSVKSNTT